MEKLASHVINSFSERWSSHPTIVTAAPGRVNLIGEHTDYTGGFVLPVAIDRQIIMAVQEIPGDSITGYSIDFAQLDLIKWDAVSNRSSISFCCHLSSTIALIENKYFSSI